jgi:hypothetical protein
VRRILEYGAYGALLALLLCGSAAVCVALFGPYTGDSERYLRLARNLAGGLGFSASWQPPYYPEVFRPPLYPLFLAGLIRVGFGVYGVIVAQATIYLVALLIVVRVAEIVVESRRAAQVLGVLLATYPPLVHWEVSITTESLCTALFCVCSWALVRHLQGPSWGNSAALGLSAAALFLTRTNYVVLAPVVIGISVMRCRGRAWRYPIVLAAFTLLPIGAWMARNVVVMPQAFKPFGVNTGNALWGRAVELGEGSIQEKIILMVNDRDVQTLHTSADPSLQIEADRRLFLRGSEVIRSHWASFLMYTLWGFMFREWVEVYGPNLPAIVLWMVAMASTLLLGLAYVGVMLVRKSWWLALPLVFLCASIAAAHAPFFMEGRYTAPVRPVLYMFSTITVVRIVEWALRGHGRGVPAIR